MARLEAASTDTRHSREIDGAEILSYYERRDRESGPLFGPHIRRFDAERLDDLLVDAKGRDHADTRLMTWIQTQAPGFRQWSQVNKAQWLDVHTVLIGYGMTCHGDRPGTGCGVETRFPFLDPALVALAAKFPVAWKLHEAVREKHILREAFRDAVPAEVVDRPKFGMRIPGPAALLPGGPDDWVEAILSPRSLRASQVLDPKAVMKLVDAAVAAGGRSLPYPMGHTYLQALSILLMESIFVRDFRVAEHDIDRIMFRKLDGEAMPSGGASPTVPSRPHGKAAD
jgi:asparagine synthase (glutamine-hydrolysing)